VLIRKPSQQSLPQNSAQEQQLAELEQQYAIRKPSTNHLQVPMQQPQQGGGAGLSSQTSPLASPRQPTANQPIPNNATLVRSASQQQALSPSQQNPLQLSASQPGLLRKPSSTQPLPSQSTQQHSNSPQLQSSSNPPSMLVRKPSNQLLQPRPQQNNMPPSDQPLSSPKQAIPVHPNAGVPRTMGTTSNDIQQQRRATQQTHVQHAPQQFQQQLQQQQQQMSNSRFSIEMIRAVVKAIHAHVVDLVERHNVPSFNEIVTESKKLVMFRQQLQRLTNSRYDSVFFFPLFSLLFFVPFFFSRLHHLLLLFSFCVLLLPFIAHD
jgi:hypothetical protein